MTVRLYTPQLVQPFGTLKNSDVNANLNLIQDAFNAINAFNVTPVSAAVGASLVRNFDVDLSSAAASSGYMTVTLPGSPAIGDPPCIVSISNSGYSSVANALASCIVTTDDGSKIMGIAPASDFNGLPFLTYAGDSMTFRFIGGSLGWVITDRNVGAYATPAAIGSLQQWDATYLHCFDGLESVIDTTAITNTVIKLDGINFPGFSCSFTIASGSLPVALNTFSASQVFNGTTGVYTIAATPNVRKRFTCLSTNHFSVT